MGGTGVHGVARAAEAFLSCLPSDLLGRGLYSFNAAAYMNIGTLPLLETDYQRPWYGPKTPRKTALAARPHQEAAAVTCGTPKATCCTASYTAGSLLKLAA